jgi:hypothetical protein
MRGAILGGLLIVAGAVAVPLALADEFATKRISAGQINGNGAYDVIPERVSADGTRAFFRTEEPLVSGDTDAVRDIYERSGGVTTWISESTPTGDFPAFFKGISSDGTRVLYSTFEQLANDDGDNSEDIYSRFAGETSLVSDGATDDDATFERASADGSKVFFTSPEKIIASDKDGAFDVYGAYLVG